MHKLKLHQDVIGAQSTPAHMKPRCPFLFSKISLLPFSGIRGITLAIAR